MTNLVLTPAQPNAGQQVAVALTIKNNCNVAVNVPWEIGGQASLIVGAGVQSSVPAGSSFTVSANWTATAGQSGVYGWADPKNVLKESTADRANNMKTNPITVGTISKSTAGGEPVRRVEQVLNYTKVKDAGARFNLNMPAGTVGCASVMQGDAASLSNNQSTIFWAFDCSLGATVEPEAFIDFRLKNGWKIKSVGAPSFAGQRNNADWEWVVRPTEGSDNPRLKMKLSGTLAATLTLYVRIMIEGPEGTCPYTNTSGACP